jgi:plasmid maintenance system antidote protein VapI
MNPHIALREWIDKRQMSRMEVATALGIDSTYVAHLIGGGRTPGLALAVRISRLTGIPAESWVKPEGVIA